MGISVAGFKHRNGLWGRKINVVTGRKRKRGRTYTPLVAMGGTNIPFASTVGNEGGRVVEDMAKELPPHWHDRRPP